ncbi:MAG: glycosyltransferase [Calothrix sp. C42_A2020_038]|nr:glycosyltransferase [Calothrix sp. C42_A2020_038]
MKRTPSVHLWIPNLFCLKGGIQVYSEFFLKALSISNPELNQDVFLKHDAYSHEYVPNSNNHRYYFAGQYSPYLRTFTFTLQILFHGLWQRPSLIFSNHLNFSIVAYWLKCLVGTPYWITVYGIEAWNVENTSLKKALKNADKILSISNYTRDRLIHEQNIDPSKISLLPCTFDISRFKIAPKPEYLLQQYKLKPSQPVILTVARLAETEKYKGYDQILKSLPQIRNSIPNIHYILVGKGNDKSRIEQLITQLDLQDHVTLAGFVPDEQLCDYYNLCDVFAMPSKKEGFGIVYLEALACGKPVLAGNQDGSVDAVCQGELGALVNPDDTQEIAQTLIQILKGAYPNPLIYQPEALRQKVVDTFGFERFQQTLASHLHEHFQPRG